MEGSKSGIVGITNLQLSTWQILGSHIGETRKEERQKVYFVMPMGKEMTCLDFYLAEPSFIMPSLLDLTHNEAGDELRKPFDNP